MATYIRSRNQAARKAAIAEAAAETATLQRALQHAELRAAWEARDRRPAKLDAEARATLVALRFALGISDSDAAKVAAALPEPGPTRKNGYVPDRVSLVADLAGPRLLDIAASVGVEPPPRGFTGSRAALATQ